MPGAEELGDVVLVGRREICAGAHDDVFPDDDRAVMAGRTRSEDRRKQFLGDDRLEDDRLLDIDVEVVFALDRDQSPDLPP